MQKKKQKKQEKKKTNAKTYTQAMNPIFLQIEKQSLAKIKSKFEVGKTSLRSSTKIVIKRTIILPTAPGLFKHKTSCSFGNLYIYNGKFET